MTSSPEHQVHYSALVNQWTSSSLSPSKSPIGFKNEDIFQSRMSPVLKASPQPTPPSSQKYDTPELCLTLRKSKKKSFQPFTPSRAHLQSPSRGSPYSRYSIQKHVPCFCSFLTLVAPSKRSLTPTTPLCLLLCQ